MIVGDKYGWILRKLQQIVTHNQKWYKKIDFNATMILLDFLLVSLVRIPWSIINCNKIFKQDNSKKRMVEQGWSMTLLIVELTFHNEDIASHRNPSWDNTLWLLDVSSL